MKFREEKLKNEGLGKWIVTIDGEEYDKILVKAKNKAKNNIEIPGFRKGKAPVSEVEKYLTPNRIYNEAYHLAIDPAFQFALDSERTIKAMNSPEPKLNKVSDKLMELEFVFDLVPEIKLGQYTGITSVKKTPIKVSEDEIQTELKKYQERFLMEKTRMADEKIQTGDSVKFDFTGLINNEPFKGGDAKDYTLVIGSNQFVPGFEDAMIGLGLGQHEIKVTFPKEYSPELGGKETLFKLDIKEIRERIYPEVDAELIKDLNLKDVKTLAELKAKIKSDLKLQKTYALKNEFVNSVVEEIIKNSEIEIPKSAIDHQVKELKKEFEQEVVRQGLTLKDYKKLANLTDADIEKEILGDAKIRLESYLVTNEIRNQEKFEVDETKIEAKYQELAQQFSLEVTKLKTLLPVQQISDEILSETLNDFLYQNNG